MLSQAILRSREQLETKWQRRDTTEEAALLVRREMLALQRVEHNLTDVISEVDNE